MAPSNNAEENRRHDRTQLQLQRQQERPTRFTNATEHHERRGQAGEGLSGGYVLQEERAKSHASPPGSSPSSLPTTSHVFPPSGNSISEGVAGEKAGSSPTLQAPGGSSAKNGYSHPDASINVSRHVKINASANPQGQDIMGQNGIYGYAPSVGAGGAGVEERERSVSGTATHGFSAQGYGRHPNTNTNEARTGGKGGVSAASGTGAGAGTGNTRTVTSSTSMPTTTSSAAPRSSTSVHPRRGDDQATRRPSLASPLPPTPLVPSSSPQRFPTFNSSPFPDAGSSASPALTPPRAALASTSSSASPSPAQIPALQARNLSRSLTSISSSTPLFPSPSYTAHTNPNASSPNSHPSLSRPLTAPSSPLATTLSVRPDSPSTAMMMKRLLSKPAPVGHGYNTQSGSESETFSGLAGIGAGGYTRRTKEALAMQQQKPKNGRRVPEHTGGGPSFMDIEFDVNLDALDDRIATLGDWSLSSSPLPPGAVRIGTGMDTPQHRPGYKRGMGDGTPGSSPGHPSQMYRLPNGSGSASGHGHGGSSSSSPIQSSVWVEVKEKEAERGKEKEKKEKRKPNVLRRKASATAAISSLSGPPASSSSVLTSTAQSRPPPQSRLSPIPFSPDPPQNIPNPQIEGHSSSYPASSVNKPSFTSTSNNQISSPSAPAYTHLPKIRPLPKLPSPTTQSDFSNVTPHYESNLQKIAPGPDDNFARTGYLRSGPGQIESNEMLRLRDHQQGEEDQSMDGPGLWQAQHQQKPLPEQQQSNLHHQQQRHDQAQDADDGKQGQSGGPYHHQHQQLQFSSLPREESESSLSNVEPVSRSRSTMSANTSMTANSSTAVTPSSATNTVTTSDMSSDKKIGSKNTSSIHRSASASAALSSNHASSSRSTKHPQSEIQEEAFREYQREYQLEYLRFRAESANIKMNATTKNPTVPNNSNGNTLHPPSFSYTRPHSPSGSASASPSPSRSAFGGLSRSMSLAGSSVGSSRGGRSVSRDSNREDERERRLRKRLGDSPLPSPLPSPISASTRIGSDTEGLAGGTLEKAKAKSPSFFGVRAFGRDGAKGQKAELDDGKVKRAKEKEKERGRAKVPSTTPAASFIEAYKRQERERDELARMARGDDIEASFEGKVREPQGEEAERLEMNRRYRATETDARTTESEEKHKPTTRYTVDEGRLASTTAGASSTSLVPSRRHSVSLSSSLSLSTIANGTIPHAKSTTTTPQTTATPAHVTIRRNMTVDGSTLLQRKSGFSFASAWTTDSGIDLDVGRRLGEADGGGGKGFDVIERYMSGGGPSAHLPSASAPTAATTIPTTAKDYLGVALDEAVDPAPTTTTTTTTTTTAVTSSTSTNKFRSVSTPAIAPETRPESADVAPYYTVFGSSSGRTVAVGSREDAWAAYEQGRVSTSASGGERAKERGGLGRTLSRKVSGRWKRQTGGTTVFEHGRASMQHDIASKKKVQEGKANLNRRSLRLSIEKLADESVVKAVNGAVWDESNSRTPLQTTPAKDVSPGSGGNSLGSAGGGGRFWKLMKRISIGAGLRDRYQEQPSTQCLPPVPPLPDATVNRVLHGSRSIDSSLKNGRLGKSSSTSASSSPGLPSSSRPSMSSSLTAPTKNSPLPPPPIPPPSSIPVSASAISRSLSTNSSTSSLPVGTPPLPTTFTDSLQQPIVSPGKLRKAHDHPLTTLKEPQDSQQAHSQTNDQQQHWNISINIPRHGSSPIDDWTIVRSPSVELSSLPLPPRRFMMPQAASEPLSMTAAANSVAGVGVNEQGVDEAEKSFGSGSRRYGGIDEEEDGDEDEDDDRGANRSESPTIPSFSTSDVVNSFPSRRASASLSQRSKNSPAVSPVGGSSQSPLSTLSAMTLVGLPPPPPRPTRSAQRPAPSSSPWQSQSPSASLLPLISPNDSRTNPVTESSSPLSGRKSESHLSSISTSKNTMHHRRSSGGLSTITIKAFNSKRRSSSFGVSAGYAAPVAAKDGSGLPVFGTFGKNSAHHDAGASLSRGKVNELGEMKETNFALTEQEKAAKWADLLERSERAGGTLRVDLGVGV